MDNSEGIKVVERIQREFAANPLWPFEPGYTKMTPDEQRDSRLRVLRGWYDLEDPKTLVADRWAFVRGMVLFLEYYIKGWDENRQWYSLPTPAMHYQWLWEITFPKTAIAAYRSSGKSTTIGKNVPMFIALTRPKTHVGLVLINHLSAAERVRDIQRQLENNPKILADFGSQKGARGGRTWNTRILELPNGSILKSGTVKSAMRGGRPDWFILDDPEKDAEMQNPELLDKFRQELLRVMLPTLDPGKHFTWIGTLINVRAILHNVVNGEDPLFGHWNKVSIKLIETRTDGSEYSTWDAKYSVSDSKLMQAGGSEDGKVIGIGRSAFLAEYQNNPVPDDAYTFRFNPPEHTYYISSHTENRTVHHKTTTLPWDNWLAGLRKAVVVDPAYTQTITSDYTCVMVGGVDKDGVLWVLDYVLDKITPNDTIGHIFGFCDKFDVELVGIESNGLQRIYYSQIQEQAYQYMSAGKTKKMPRIIPIMVGSKSKGERIQSLEWRFNANKIRIRRPAILGETGMDDLEEQIMHFTPSLKGLKHDDAIDALEILQRTLSEFSRPTELPAHPSPDYDAEIKELGVQPRWFSADRIPWSAIQEQMRRKFSANKPSSGKFDTSMI